MTIYVCSSQNLVSRSFTTSEALADSQETLLRNQDGVRRGNAHLEREAISHIGWGISTRLPAPMGKDRCKI